MIDSEKIKPQINLQPGTAHTSTDGCFQHCDPVFAMPKHGNKVEKFTTGKDLFADIAKAIQGAQKFILFTDWQMDFDVELINRGDKKYSGRFSELLAERVRHGVEVKVLLYDSIEAAVYTHENEVRENLMKLNPTVNQLGKNGAPARNPAGNLPVEVATQRPATGRAGDNVLFSHHQKSIVIDGTVAFVGGMDITYGRWCDNNFDVVADPVKHRICDMYNPGLGQGRELTAEEKKQTQDWAGLQKPSDATYGPPRPGFSKPYYIIGIMEERITQMVERGYTFKQLDDMIQLMEVDDQIRKYFVQKCRELKAILLAIQRTANKYGKAKAAAGKKLLDGHPIDALGMSIQADIDLMKVVLRQLDKAVQKAWLSVSDSIGSKTTGFADWFDKEMADIKGDLVHYKQYRDNPSLLWVEYKRIWSDRLGKPNQIADDFTLEEGCQPRMPWQDVHCKITGPVVHDVFANFVRRWNVAVLDNRDNTAKGVDKKTGRDHLVKQLSNQWLARWGGAAAVFGDLSKHGTAGNTTVQILRSAAASLLAKEAKHAPLLPLPGLLGATINKEKGLANNTAQGEGQMDGILEAMIHAIRSAKAYIYIETQFFISNCGKSDKYEVPIADNPLIDELLIPISGAITTNKPFHVYIVLPVHPEGNLADGGVAKQHYWALQSLKRGRFSLVRRICNLMAIKQKNIKPGKDPDEKDVQALYDSGAWKQYLTVLNLRNWGITTWFPRDSNVLGLGTNRRLDREKPLGFFAITEQIYVHSKLTIVDDAIAIIGSANCNDRSLQGNGDTELAAVIVDNESIQELDLGNGEMISTRGFARELRKDLWKKHLGLKIEDKDYTQGGRVLELGDDKVPRHPLAGFTKDLHPPRTRKDSAKGASAVNLDQPANPATWQAIQKIAKRNAAAYEAVFQHTPRNSMAYFRNTENGWPRRRSSVGMFTDLSADFSTVPPQLNKGYMMDLQNAALKLGEHNNPYKDFHIAPHHLKDHIHNIRAVAAYLSANLTGFWVEMPLEFGSRERDVWLQGHFGNTAVAQNDVPPASESATLLSQNEISNESQTT